MKRVGLIIFFLLLSVFSLNLMYTQRMQETVQLWKHYNILYVSKEYSEQDIFELCRNGGADGIISRHNSLFSVKNIMMPSLAPYDNDGFTSESMRSFFFSDKSKGYFLLYVPEDSLPAAVKVLEKENIPFGIDASAEYPVLCPILCFAAFILLILLNRVAFSKALCLLPLIAVSYAVPFYSVAAAVCCMLFIFIICDLYEKRSGAAYILSRKAALYVVLAAGLTAACLSGVKAILLFSAGLSFSFLLLSLRRQLINLSYEESHFKPILIVNARWIDITKRYNLKTLATMLSVCICFLIFSFFSGILQTGIKTQDLLLPSPSVYTENVGFTESAYAELYDIQEKERNPDLSDFLNEKWYAQTAAYRKVNNPYTTVQAGEIIKLPSFVDDENGHVVEIDKTLFSFDDSWISSAAGEFSESEGIERLLVSQEGFFTTDYASTGKLETSSLILPATIICVLCFLVLAVVYCFKRLKK